MSIEDSIIEKIKRNLALRQPQGRYEHTLGVVKAACNLAKKHGVSVEKAEIAALLHDYAKDLSERELKEYIRDNHLEVDKSLLDTYQLLHGIVGAHMATKEFGIKDEEILLAIRYHTTGRANMIPLEKIIYLSDFIEENRNFSGVNMLRELAYKDLDYGLLQGFNNTIQFLLKTDKVLHCNTVDARNQILKEQQQKESN